MVLRVVATTAYAGNVPGVRGLEEGANSENEHNVDFEEVRKPRIVKKHQPRIVVVVRGDDEAEDDGEEWDEGFLTTPTSGAAGAA